MKKKLLVILPLLLLATAIVLYFYFKDNSTLEKDSPEDVTAITQPNEPLTAQENFTEGDERDPGNTLREDEGSGYIEDTNGTQQDSEIDPDSWTISEDALIKLYSPSENTTLSNGDVFSGESSIYDEVFFRLIDNVSGVISEGSISVVNGKFSGKFNFSTTATEGRIDVFYRNPDGTEKSNINVPVVF